MNDTTLPNDDRPVGERIAELAERLPQEMVEQLPTDGASRLDHYLYAAQWTPKPPFGDSWIEYVIAQPCGHHNRDDDRRYARAELEALRDERDALKRTVQYVEAVLGGEQYDARTAADAADTALRQAVGQLTAVSVERDRLRAACEQIIERAQRDGGVHTCSDVCQRPACVCRRALEGKDVNDAD